MVKREFTWGEDQNGTEGWILDGMPHFDASYGLTVAHDCLEHFDLGDQITDEWQAFGAMLYGRGMCGSLYGPYHTTASNMASDIVRFLADTEFTTPVRRTTRHWDDCVEDELAQLGREILKGIRSEYDSCGWDGLPKGKDRTNLVRNVLDWVRVGYRRAERRWKHIGPGSLDYLFVQIRDEVDKKSRHREFDEKLIVRFSPTTAEFSVQVLTLDDLYPDDDY